MATPLSQPVALAGTAMARFTEFDLGVWFVGYVYLLAFAVLTMGALVGIRLATPWIGRIPDRVHARVYVGLLVLVMISMSLN